MTNYINRRIFAALISLLAVPLAISAADANNRIKELEKIVTLENRLNKVGIGDALEYASLLYESSAPEDIAKADAVLETAISYQCSNDPESGNYGLWPWRVGSEIGDKNTPLFHGHIMFGVLWNYQNRMSDTTRKIFLDSCERIVVAAERRYDEELFEPGRDGIPYSNIFALYVQTLTLAADRFQNERLRRKSVTQWQRFYNHVSFYGVSEFLSTTYYQLIFDALKDIAVYNTAKNAREDATKLMDFLYLQQSAVTHPLLKMQVVGIGRDYREFTKFPDARVDFLKKPVEGYQPTEQAVSINTARKYPFYAWGRAGMFPFVYKTYQLEHSAMGSMSGNGNYYEQQIYCMAVTGENEFNKASLFIPGSNMPVNGFTCQDRMSTLCVFNMLPTMWHLTQWKGDMENYRSTYDPFGIGITEKFEVLDQKEDHILLRAYGNDIHLFPFKIKDGKALPSEMKLVKRKTTSKRYHARPNNFREFLFEADTDWYGVVVTMVSQGQKVNKPSVKFSRNGDYYSFSAGRNLSVKVARTSEGNCVQVHEGSVDMIPRLEIQ